jgi:hypothetical protein
LASAYSFSNAGLLQDDNWRLALHGLGVVPDGSRIVFDEYHHGLTEHGTFQARLVREPWGWALLLGGALVLAYLVLAGRRFGRPLAPVPAGPRRSRAEYVETLAMALRRGQHQVWLRREYAAQVRRGLAGRYHVAPELPPDAMAAALSDRRPEAAELARPLARLEGVERLNERELVELMREVEALRAGVDRSEPRGPLSRPLPYKGTGACDKRIVCRSSRRSTRCLDRQQES